MEVYMPFTSFPPLSANTMDILVSRLTFFSVNQVYISKIVLSDSF